MSTPYHRRRRRNRGAALIIVISTVLMACLLVLFFAPAVKQSETNGNVLPEDPLSPTSGDTVSPPIGGVSADVLPPETTALETEAPVETEEPKKEYVPPKIVPVTYNADLLAKVALPEGEMPDGYVDKLIFYGDSTTHGMKSYKVFGSRDTKQVWTPQSGTLALFRAATDLVWDPVAGEDKSLSDLCADNKPEYLVMTLGVNGVSMYDRDTFKIDYQNLINIILTASPDTKLILQSIYPVARSYAKQDVINNKKIQAANEWIVEIANENNLPYLNTYSALIGADGYLPESYQNGDGMHFNEVGFAAVMDYVKSHPCLS